MAELTQSAGAGSCHMDGYVQGNLHRVDDMIFERNPSFFKIKVLGVNGDRCLFIMPYNPNV